MTPDSILIVCNGSRGGDLSCRHHWEECLQQPHAVHIVSFSIELNDCLHSSKV